MPEDALKSKAIPGTIPPLISAPLGIHLLAPQRLRDLAPRDTAGTAPGGGSTPQGPHVVCPEQAEAEMIQNSWHMFGFFTPCPTGKAPKMGTVMLVAPPR